ncbi:MAG: hypothetical protein JNM32_07265 [Dechloromonas sp.]|nr:hypothetical protein [Dechloromonas sp.]
MRSRSPGYSHPWRRAIVTAFVLLFFHAALPVRADDVFEHPESRLRLPERLGNFERGRIHRYDDPRLGVQVTYRASGLGKLDVYLFDYGSRDIPDGIASEQVQAAFAKADQEIQSFGASGQYRELQRLTAPGISLRTPPGDPPWLLAAYRLRAGADPAPPLVSWLLLGASRAHFVKVRFTHAAEQTEIASSEISAFVRALADANRP